MKKSDRQSGKFLADFFWNLLLVAVVAMTCYVFFTRGYLDPYWKKVSAMLAVFNQPNSPAPSLPKPSREMQPAEPAATPAPVATPVATPAPSTPPPVATPVPTPSAEPPIALNTLEPRYLPQKVKLLKGISDIPVVSDGQVAGTTSLPPGVLVPLIAVKGDQVEVEAGGSVKLIPATDTDIADRVRILMGGVGDAPSATPVPTPWVPMYQGTKPATKH